MTKEEKQLLLKDISARLPYGVKCRASYSKFPTTLVDVNVDANVGDDFFIVTVKLEKTGLNSPSLIEDIRPYLRPMSSMTEEEIKEFRAFHCVDGLHPYFYQQMCNLQNLENMFNWLNAHHFDYRGLIVKGLALEAPEGMYQNR